tara:strand:- start:2146 stop:2613 length:468 start_codon:yes stop_codon:yes gene_type:complete
MNVMSAEEVLHELDREGILDIVELGIVPEDVVVDDDAVLGVMLKPMLREASRILAYALEKGYRKSNDWRVQRVGEGPHLSVTKNHCPHFFLVLYEQDGKLLARYLNSRTPDDEELGRLTRIVNDDLRPGFSNEVTTFNEVLLAYGETCADPRSGQ